MSIPKEWEIDDAAVEELRKVLPRYPSSLARAIASEAAHDFNDEHYASDAEYTLAQWFDAALTRHAQRPLPITDEMVAAGANAMISADTPDGPAYTTLARACLVAALSSTDGCHK